MEKIDVSFWKKKQHLCEICQLIGMQYAFLSPNNEQCHAWIKCRDFLHDALRCHFTGKSEIIFGFSYTPGKDPELSLKKMRMLVKRQPNSGEDGASKSTKEMMDSALSIIQCIEDCGGIKPTSTIQRTSKDKDVYVFEGSSDWMESTFMISMYTFLIRLGGRKIVFENKRDLDSQLKKLSKSRQANNDNDISYLKTVQPYIHKIVEKRGDLRYVKKDGKHLFENQTVNLFHNYTGIVALADQASAKKSGSNNDKIEELITLSKCLIA